MDIRFTYAAFATWFCKYVRIVKHDSKYFLSKSTEKRIHFCGINYNLHTECDKKNMHEIATQKCNFIFKALIKS